MKYNILLFVLISTICLSCKKDKQASPENTKKLYPVNFSVNGFSQTQVPATNTVKQGKTVHADTPLNTILDKLHYRLYKTEGKFIKMVTQLSSQQGYGVFADSLEAGNYTAVFLGATALYTFPTNGKDSIYLKDPQSVFYKKLNFTVGSGSESQSLRIERANARLELIVKDPAPESVSIKVEYADYQYFSIFKSKFSGNIDIRKYYGIIKGVKNQKFIIPAVLNVYTPIAISITASDINGTVIAKKIAYMVNFYPNTTTILSGNLFTSNPIEGNAGFIPTFETTLAGDDIIKNF